MAALEMALATGEGVSAGALVHHSDRGVQYACGDYIGRLEAWGILPGMSRAGCPYDNAMAESFMKSPKTEAVDSSEFRTLAETEVNIGRPSRRSTTATGCILPWPACHPWNSTLV